MTDLPMPLAHASRITRLGDRLPEALPLLAARVFPAVVFWLSARTKVEGLTITDSTFFLFENLYDLPVIPSAWAAVLATVAEHVLALMLLAGFLARFAALGLLTMTAVIQVFVFPEAWVTHGLWAACFLMVIARGPGALSVDHLLGLDRR